jgi:hypothetical protein
MSHPIIRVCSATDIFPNSCLYSPFIPAGRYSLYIVNNMPIRSLCFSSMLFSFFVYSFWQQLCEAESFSMYVCCPLVHASMHATDKLRRCDGRPGVQQRVLPAPVQGFHCCVWIVCWWQNGRPLSLVNTDSCRWRRILECFVTFCAVFGVFTIRRCKKVDLIAYACLSLFPHGTIQGCETIAFSSYANVYRPITSLINMGRDENSHESSFTFVFWTFVPKPFIIMHCCI